MTTIDPVTRYAEAHQRRDNIDARPTALQIVQDEDLLSPALLGKVYVITGCSSGIGVETARAIAATGAQLYLPVRDIAKGQAALSDILQPGRVELVKMDMMSLDSVRAAGAEIMEKSGGKVNGLICNAGVMAMPFTKTVDGNEAQFGTNHLAHFLLFQILLPALLSSSTPEWPSRVVTVSSTGHRTSDVRLGDYNFEDPSRGEYDPWVAYGQSKSANVYMVKEIERLWGTGSGLNKIHANSLHPGGIWSGLQVHVPEEQVAQWKQQPGIDKFMKSEAQGAATTVWAALGAVWKNRGGEYLEDCQLATVTEKSDLVSVGYAPHVMNEQTSKQLWADSLKMVGLERNNE